jgi:Cu-Zn family superoxide dismutase
LFRNAGFISADGIKGTEAAFPYRKTRALGGEIHASESIVPEKPLLAGIFCVLLLLAAGCHEVGGEEGGQASPGAACDVAPVGGSGVTGRATFYQQGDILLITIDLMGLAPGPHEVDVDVAGHGSCSEKGEDAGGDSNAGGQAPGAGVGAHGHAGDLGNIVADGNDMAHLQVEDRALSLDGRDSVVGLALVVYAGEDDLTTRASRDSGARIGCGMIYRMEP